VIGKTMEKQKTFIRCAPTDNPIEWALQNKWFDLCLNKGDTKY